MTLVVIATIVVVAASVSIHAVGASSPINIVSNCGKCRKAVSRRSALVLVISMFDGLDRLIFPLRMWLVALTKTKIHLTMLADGGRTDRTGNG